LLQNRSETALHGIAENRSFGLFSSAADGGTTMSSAKTPAAALTVSNFIIVHMMVR
jgi:hypothetical protein